MIIQKLPDFEGGFTTKEIAGDIIITRNNGGNILFTETRNVLRKGLKTSYGKITEIGERRVTLLKGAREVTADRELLNSCVLKENKISKSVGGRRRISGTFITPIGEIEINDCPDYTRDILTNPDKIVHEADKSIFHKRINKSLHTIEVQERIFDRPLFKSLSTEPIGRPAHRIRIKKALPKIFNIGNTSTKSAPSTGGGGAGWNQKGGVKPGHKYLQRKPHPSGEGYIYLYKLADGNTAWKDQEGNKVGGGGEKEKGKDSKEELTFKKGDFVKRGDQVGKVLKTSDNFIAINFEGKNEVVNRKEHLERVKAERQFKEKQIIKHKGKNAKILRLTDNLALIKTMDTGDFEVIKLTKEITPVEPEPKRVKGDKRKSTGIEKHAYVYQGYSEQDRRYNYEEQELENDPDFQEFDSAAEEAGFGRVDDITRRKFVKVGNETHAVTWEYDPEFNEVDVLVDGLKEHPIEYGDRRFVIRNITEDGYSLADPETGEAGIFLSHKDYKEWKQSEENKQSQRFVMRKNRRGDVVVSDSEKKTIRYTPEYTEEQLERFRGKPRRWSKKNEPVQDEARKAEIEKEQKQKEEKIKEALESESYQKFKSQIKDRGFEITQNNFIGRKKVDVEGRKFDVRAHFDPKTEQYKTEVTGPVQSVIMKGEKHPITDVSDDKVYYRKGNYEKSISIDELKDINGKTIFTPAGENKGIVSEHDSFKVYFGDDEKNVVSAYYEVVEADDIISSHGVGGEANSNYSIADAQNRDRSTAQSIQQINRIANNPIFDFVGDSKTADRGAPIINEEYNAIAGNGRAIGLKLHYAQGGDKYKDDLLKNAENLGFDRSEIESMKQPILVRKTDVDNKEAQRLGAISNQDNKLGQEEREKAKGMATRIDDNTFNKISSTFQNAKGEFSSISDYLDEVGPEIVKDLITKDIIPENDRHLYFDQKTGKLNSAHKEKVKNLLTQSLLGEASQHYEHIPDASREGITKSLGDVFSLKGKEGDLTPHIKDAVKILAQYNATKDNFKGPDDFLSQAQNDALEPLSADKKALALFDLFAGTKPNEMKNKIREYKTSMEADMFSEGLEPEAAFEKVFEPKYEKGINKSLRSRAKLLLKGAVSRGKNILLPSKKNPAIKRWQKHEYDEGNQLSIFGGESGEKAHKTGEKEKGRRGETEERKSEASSQKSEGKQKADEPTANIENNRVIYKGEDVGLVEIKKHDDGVEIEKLYLDEAHQRKGIGKEIIKNLLAENEKLLVYPSPKSQPFWYRLADNIREDGYVEITKTSFEKHTGNSDIGDVQKQPDKEMEENRQSDDGLSYTDIKDAITEIEDKKRDIDRSIETYKNRIFEYSDVGSYIKNNPSDNSVVMNLSYPKSYEDVFEEYLKVRFRDHEGGWDENAEPALVKVKLGKTDESRKYKYYEIKEVINDNGLSGYIQKEKTEAEKKLSSLQDQSESYENSLNQLKENLEARENPNEKFYKEEIANLTEAMNSAISKKHKNIINKIISDAIEGGILARDDYTSAWYMGAKQYVTNLIRTLGGKKYYKSNKDVSGSIYYNLPNGDEIRISDHFLPETETRMSNREMGLTGDWIQIILDEPKPFSNLADEILSNLKEQLGEKSVTKHYEGETKEILRKINSLTNKKADDSKEPPTQQFVSKPQSQNQSNTEAVNDDSKSELNKVEVNKQEENPLQIYTENFKNWFGDWENDPENASKVVDGEGKPLRVYHGSPEVFTEFDKDKTTEESLNVFWFTTDKSEAEEFSNDQEDEIMQLYLNIRNLGDGEDFDKISAQVEVNDNDQFSKLAEEAGFDGFLVNGNNYIVLEPNQIKSATGNKGSFDKDNPDITKSLRRNKEDG